MQGVSNPQGLLRVTWSDKWALLKEYNVFLNYFIDGRGTASPGTHTNWLNTLWKGQFGLHFPFLRYLHLESCWRARRELGWALRRFGKFQHLLTFKRFFHCTRNLLIVCVCFVAGLWVTLIVSTSQNCHVYRCIGFCIYLLRHYVFKGKGQRTMFVLFH